MIHKQTKESFERYLENVRSEWQTKYGSRNRPEQRRVFCAACENDKPLRLRREKLDKTIGPHTWQGVFFVYQCPKCGERFTTTETVAISMASMKLKNGGEPLSE